MRHQPEKNENITYRRVNAMVGNRLVVPDFSMGLGSLPNAGPLSDFKMGGVPYLLQYLPEEFDRACMLDKRGPVGVVWEVHSLGRHISDICPIGGNRTCVSGLGEPR